MDMTKQDKANLSSKLWRLENLYNIKTKDGRKIKFKLNPAQRHYLDNRANRNIILKSRQLGFSTFEEIDCLDDALFNPNTDCMIIAQGRDEAEDLFDNKVRFAWDNLPERFRKLFFVDSDSTKTLKFDFGNGSKSSVRVRTSGRSGTYRHVHVSEFAKICIKFPAKAKEILTGTIPAVPTDGKVTIESTAEGQDGLFHDMFWTAFRRGDVEVITDYKAHFYNWTWDKAEIADMPDMKVLPDKFREIQELHGFTNKEIVYYYLKWKSLNQDWEALYQEYPITAEQAFDVAIKGAYWHKQLQQSKKENRICAVPYEKSLPVYTVWDLGKDDEMVIWFFQIFGKEIRWIDVYHNNGENTPFYFSKMAEKPYINYEAHILPWDAEVKRLDQEFNTKEIFMNNAQNYPRLNLGGVVITRTASVIVAINEARGIFSQFWFDKEKCAEGLVQIAKYRKKWDEKYGRYLDKPEHGMESHFADPIRLFALWYKDNANVEKRPRYIHKPSKSITGY